MHLLPQNSVYSLKKHNYQLSICNYQLKSQVFSYLCTPKSKMIFEIMAH